MHGIKALPMSYFLSKLPVVLFLITIFPSANAADTNEVQDLSDRMENFIPSSAVTVSLRRNTTPQHHIYPI